MVTLYGIPNCDTVKKARAWLAEQGVEYRFRYEWSDRSVQWSLELKNQSGDLLAAAIVLPVVALAQRRKSLIDGAGQGYV